MKFTKTTLEAKDAMVDDWFDMEGEGKRITSITERDDVVDFSYAPETNLDCIAPNTIVHNREDIITVYNQTR